MALSFPCELSLQSPVSKAGLLYDLIKDRCRKHNIPPIKDLPFDIIKLIAENQDPEVMRLEVLPAVVAMSQDVSEDVRVAVSLCLDAVAMHSEKHIFNTSFMNIIVDLMNDSSSIVRRAAFDAFTNIVTIMPEDMLSTYGISIATKFIKEGLSSDPDTMIMIAFLFGKLCLSLSRTDISEEDQSFLVHAFISLTSIGYINMDTISLTKPVMDVPHEKVGPEQLVRCRLCCIHSFPDVFIFCEKMETSTSVTTTLKITFSHLMVDKCYEVRKAAVDKLDQIYHYFFDEWRIFLGRICDLMTLETNENILGTLVPKLGEIISEAASARVFIKETDHCIWPFLTSISDLELKLSSGRNFRLYKILFEQMEQVISSFDVKAFLSRNVPEFLDRLMKNRGIPMRLAVAKFLLVSIRHAKDPAVVSSIHNVINEDLGRSSNSYNRILFVKLCYIIMDIFSIPYFKTYFYETLIVLAEDPIPNVRIAFAKIAPFIWKMNTLYNDEKELKKLSALMLTLEGDDDIDVRFFTSASKKDVQSDNAKIMEPFLLDKDKLREEEQLSLYTLKSLDNLSFSNSGTNSPRTTARQCYFYRKYEKIINKLNKPTNNPAGESNSEDISEPLSSCVKFEANNNQFPKLSSSTITSCSKSNGNDLSRSLNHMSDQEFMIDAGVSISVTTKNGHIGEHKANWQNSSISSNFKCGVPIRQKQFSYRKPTIASLKRHSTLGVMNDNSSSKTSLSSLQESLRLSVDETTLLRHNCDVNASSVANNANRKSSHELGSNMKVHGNVGLIPKSRIRAPVILNGLNLRNKNITTCRTSMYSTSTKIAHKFPSKVNDVHNIEKPNTDEKLESSVPVRRRTNLKQDSKYAIDNSGLQYKQRVVSVVDGRLGILHEPPSSLKQNKIINIMDPLKIDNESIASSLDKANNNRLLNVGPVSAKHELKESFNKGGDAKDVSKRHTSSQLPRPLSGNSIAKSNKALVNASSRLPISRIPDRSGRK